MNSLDAFAAAAKEDAGITRDRHGKLRPVWPPATGRPLADYAPAPGPLHPMFRLRRLASPKIRAFVDQLARACTTAIDSTCCLAPAIKRTKIQFFNRANRPWYTKLLINRASIAP